MCAKRDDFGIRDTMRAADTVSCRCGDTGCVLPPQPGDVVRYQIDNPKVAEVESDD